MVRGRAALVWVEGPDAAGFLQGLLSNEVAGLPPGAATRALLLDAKGHVQADLRVRRDAADAFTLVLDPAAGDLVAELLDRYHFSEDLELIGPEEAETLTLPSASAAVAAGADLVVPSILPGAVEAVVDDPGAAVAALGLPEAPAGALEAARVAAGRGAGGRGHRPVHAGAGGRPGGRRRLLREGLLPRPGDRRPRAVPGPRQPPPPRPAPDGRAARRRGGRVLLGAREVGRMTSAAEVPGIGPVGLAILRREAEDGAAVEVEPGGGGPPVAARVVELPFRAA